MARLRILNITLEYSRVNTLEMYLSEVILRSGWYGEWSAYVVTSM
jgi:hypothetical protein